MSPYLIERITDKNDLLYEARQAKDIVTWHRARLLKNTVNLELDTARNVYYKELSDAYFKDSKRFWSVLKEVIPSSKSSSKSINIVDDQGSPVLKDNTASYVNNFFAEIGPKLAENHDQPFTFFGDRCDETG